MFVHNIQTFTASFVYNISDVCAAIFAFCDNYAVFLANSKKKPNSLKKNFFLNSRIDSGNSFCHNQAVPRLQYTKLRRNCIPAKSLNVVILFHSIGCINFTINST